jgi:hypothetical protein
MLSLRELKVSVQFTISFENRHFISSVIFFMGRFGQLQKKFYSQGGGKRRHKKIQLNNTFCSYEIHQICLNLSRDVDNFSFYHDMHLTLGPIQLCYCSGRWNASAPFKYLTTGKLFRWLCQCKAILPSTGSRIVSVAALPTQSKAERLKLQKHCGFKVTGPTICPTYISVLTVCICI